MDIKNNCNRYFSKELADIFTKIPGDFWDGLQEIRLRIGKPLFIRHKNTEYTISATGELYGGSPYSITENDIQTSLSLMSDYSLYAFEDELKNGYITLPGGHRVGVTGKTVINHNDVATLKYYNGLNIRISHEIKGCADKLITYLTDNNPMHTIIISPPGCGKTTLLRDIIRLFSEGGFNVSVVDERSEIAGCYKGIPQNDLGPRTDVLDACPKAKGMIMLLRSMSPDIIAVDEAGSRHDFYAIEEIINSGVVLLCTLHGNNPRDIASIPAPFKRRIVLSNRLGSGTIEGIYNEKNENLYTLEATV